MQMILDNILFVIALIGFIILYGGIRLLGTGHYMIFLIGLFILLPFIIYYFYSNYKYKNVQKKRLEELIKFKHDANKIPVTLDYKIKTNNWTDEINVGTPREAFGNQITGNSDKNIKHVNRFSNIIILTARYMDKSEEITLESSKNPETLKMLLELNRQTYLYVNKSNSKEQYLDLEFLD